MTDIDLSSLRVLVVEDDKPTLRLVVLALEGLGIQYAATATNGEEALVVLNNQDNGINILLCDLHMPQMGAYANNC